MDLYNEFVQRKLSEQVIESIREALWPFNLGRMSLYLETDPRFFGVHIFTIETKAGWTFKFAVSDHELDYSWNPESVADRFEREAVKAFKFYRVEPEANIVLGEN